MNTSFITVSAWLASQLPSFDLSAKDHFLRKNFLASLHNWQQQGQIKILYYAPYGEPADYKYLV